MILGNGLLQSGVPSFGTLAADSSDSTLFSGYTPNVAVVGPVSQRLYFGKAGGTWKTLWTDTSGALLRGDEAGTHAVTLASNGPEPFDSDDGIATDTKSGSVAAGTTFTHEADCLIEWTQTTRPIVGTTNVHFRVESALNFWAVYVYANGDFRLWEVAGGSAVARIFVATAVSSGHKIVVVCDGTTIKCYNNNVLLGSYVSSTAATATAGEVDAIGTGGAVSNVKTWPRTLSGTAASILNKASG